MTRRFLMLSLVALLLPGALALGLMHPQRQARATVAAAPLRALLVGGGYDVAHNQVALESNIRYVHRLLPGGAFSRILFADGNPKSVNVLYEAPDGSDKYRRPRLPFLNGSSRLVPFDRQFAAVKAHPGGPLLLYFTGHGGPAEDGGYDNNEFGMWGGDNLTVRNLAAHIDRLPAHTPVIVVMVQCFSGGFGNLLFQGGDPRGPQASQDICGFFAAIPSREAAGCTPEVNEANYRDFTSYFFAALGGTDRLGHPITGADYDHDGVVGMDEAYAYALIHDVSIDTPTCTSDVFLRRYVQAPEAAIFAALYSDVRQWATPAQRAVLDGLSRPLGLSGEGRLAAAYDKIQYISGYGDNDSERDAQVIRFVRTAKSVVLAHRLLTSDDDALKSRYASLTSAEARNPLRQTQ